MQRYSQIKYLAAFVIVVPVLLIAVSWYTNNRRELCDTPPTTPEAALSELCNGNRRFVNSRRTHSTDTLHDADHRHRTAKAQNPFTAILSCSDSRVCPEFIFDQRSGTIFEVRNAGNLVDEDVLASLEYAVEHLHVPLIVVLGHKGCGAIEAVCEAGEKPLHDHLRALQTHMLGIRKQVIECNHRHNPEVVARLAQENARQQALSILRESFPLKTAVERGKVRVVYGMYDMGTGAVEFFDVGSSTTS
jgi:carbonic anhydrase